MKDTKVDICLHEKINSPLQESVIGGVCSERVKDRNGIAAICKNCEMSGSRSKSGSPVQGIAEG
jgi:hypothetical protein